MSLIKPQVKLEKTFFLADLVILIFILGSFWALIEIAKRWGAPVQPVVEISLNPWALPKYALFSLSRGFVAYFLSLIFTIIYGYVAAYNQWAEKIMIPLLDILQSIPVLAFLPGLVISLISIFPHWNIGLELACILMIFTGQVWNMTFSFYSSLKSIPQDLIDTAKVWKFGRLEKLLRLELPYASTGLIWNSMMSMAGGWFFLTVCEAFVLGNKDFRLLGIGSYMSVAIEQGNIPAMFYAILAMILLITGIDRLLWRPLVVWSQKFKFEETKSIVTSNSFMLDLFQESKIVSLIVDYLNKKMLIKIKKILSQSKVNRKRVTSLSKICRLAILILITFFVFSGVIRLFSLLSQISFVSWFSVLGRGSLTLLRTLSALFLGSLWAIPAGVVIGMNPRLSKIFQPIAQIAASFPAPMIYPLVMVAMSYFGIGLQFGAVILMMLGTQWYILFNTIAGATTIPTDLIEVGEIYHLKKIKFWRRIIFPTIFPYLVTGWITAMGGAWNASIVAEYIQFKGRMISATGLGSLITLSTAKGDFPLLAGSVLVMALIVVLLNRFIWKRLYLVARTKYALI